MLLKRQLRKGKTQISRSKHRNMGVLDAASPQGISLIAPMTLAYEVKVIYISGHSLVAMIILEWSISELRKSG